MSKIYSRIFILIFISLFIVQGVFARSLQEKLKQIDKNIQIQTNKFNKVKKIERSVISELKKITEEFNKTEKQLKAQQKKITKLKRNIDIVRKNIRVYSAKLETQQMYLKKRLRMFQRLNSHMENIHLLLIQSNDMSQFIRVMQYILDISKKDKELIWQYKNDLGILIDEQMELKKLYTIFIVEEKKLKQLEDTLKEKAIERERLLVKVQKEKREYEKTIWQLKKDFKRLSKIIQEAEKREARGKPRPKTKPYDKKEELPKTEFSILKGKFIWPIVGDVVIGFGNQVDPVFNMPIFRSGIHIKSQMGASIKAIYNGKVVYADNFKGYGKLVIISHGSGFYSLYGNLSNMYVKNGKQITKAFVIGDVGESLTIGTSGLYFEIRYKNTPLDPLQWLGNK